MPQYSTIVILALLVLVAGCASERTMQTGTEGPKPGDEVFDFCTPPDSFASSFNAGPIKMKRLRAYWDEEQYIRWSPDGSRILFNGPKPFYSWPRTRWNVDLLSVDSGGSWLEKIVASETPKTRDRVDIYTEDFRLVARREIRGGADRDPVWGDGGRMIYFDISSDNSRITYSTCAYTRVEKEEVDYYFWGGRGHLSKVVSDLSDTRDAERNEESSSWLYDYEIIVSDIDGADVKRLSKNLQLDNFPEWSPDDTKIAFISNKGIDFDRNRVNHILTIYTVSTGRLKEIAMPLNLSVALSPLSWSPDGERIAFVGWSHDSYFFDGRLGVWTIGSDGSGLKKITDAASGPAWSPDGKQIAVTVPTDEGGVALYRFAADGSGLVLVSDSLPEPWPIPENPWMGNLCWSPDGSEILLRGFGYRIPLDGSPPINHGDSPNDIMDSAWSPDGSKIAIRTNRKLTGADENRPGSKVLVYVIDRDGTNPRTLVEAVLPIHDRNVRLAQ